MSIKNRLFTYSTTPIAGASQSGSLIISDNYIDGYTWWGGPDENVGYVIAHTDTNIGVRTERDNASVISTNTVGFWRTSTKSDSEFLAIFNNIFNQNYATASVAADWLNTNGYWTSYTPSSIVTTDLSLFLDAGDLTSYSGTGLTWSDISGNGNDVAMVNSSSINWLDNGIGYFTTGSDGWFSKTSGVNLPTGNSNYTLSAWIQLGTSWNSNGIVSVGPLGSSNQANALRAGNTNQVINYWWANDFSANSSVSPTNSWFNVVAKYDGTTRSVFINGVSIGTDNPSGHNVTSSDIQVAKTYSSEYLQGNIAQVLIYSAALSDGDIVTNYNTTKSRFTLTIADNGSPGGLGGWNPTAFAIAPNPAIGTAYPVGSKITFQNGEVRTIIQIDDYSPTYIDIFYDSPISTSILFPITIG